MKKIIAWMLSLLMLCSLASCNDKEDDKAGGWDKVSESGSEKHISGKSDDVNRTDIPVEAEYIRTNGYHEGVEYPFHTVIRSADELTAYYNEYKDMYDLERKEKVYSDTTVGFLDACDKYDASFFGEKALVLVVLEEGSGSIRHVVTGAGKTDEKLHIYIESIVPEVGTCDMAEWHIIASVDKDNLPKDNDNIEIHYNEDNPQNVSYRKGYGSISVVLPKNWKSEIVDEDGVGFGIDICPDGEIEGEICLRFYNGFGVCGTGLKEETISIAGYEAWQGTYDNARWWDFIYLKDTPGDYVILNQGADAWLGEYEDELMQILDSMTIADGIITKEEAIKIADLNATVEYDSTSVRFNVSKGVWCVTLSTQGVAGGNQDIEISIDGDVVNTTYGE